MIASHPLANEAVELARFMGHFTIGHAVAPCEYRLSRLGTTSMLARLSIVWKPMIAAGCAIGALLPLAAALVATNASGMVRDLSNGNGLAVDGLVILAHLDLAARVEG